jgi:uncharacterized protein YqeY
MTSKYDNLVADNNWALKSGNQLARAVLTSILAGIKNVAIDRGCKDSITDEMVDEVLMMELKIVNEQIDTCPEDRDDLLEYYESRKAIIKTYAPSIIEDYEEVKAYIEEMMLMSDFLKLNVDNKGKAMKYFMPQLKGKVDLKMANKVIGEMFK